MQIRSTLILTAAVLGLAGCTAEPDAQTATARASGAEPLDGCFWPSQITGYSSAGDDGIYVEVGAGERYLVETLGPCPDLDFSFQVGLRNRTGGAICSPAGLEIVVPDPAGTRTCPVGSIRKVPRRTGSDG